MKAVIQRNPWTSRYFGLVLLTLFLFLVIL